MAKAEETRCPRCSALMPVGAEFCVECGHGRTKVILKGTCAVCGAILNAETGKCSECARAESPGQVIRCPKCGSEIKPGAARCANCGYQVPKQAAARAGIEPGGGLRCQNCGAGCEPEDNFCAYCGAMIPEGQKVPVFCPRCGARRGRNPKRCAACGEKF